MSVAIVTGGSRGIGAATVLALSRAGHRVVFAYRSDVVQAQRSAEAADAIAVQADVSTDAGVEKLFGAADEQEGELAVLVNNAGIVDRRARVDELSRDRIERMLAVNVIGPFLCAREAVRRMSTRHGGSGGVIVNVGSVASRIGSGGQYVDYAASKAAIDTMTLGLAQEVARESIRVACVRPGIIDTDIHASGREPNRAQEKAPEIPLGRPGTVDEIASMIAWLCSPEASYVTGAIFDVSGGR